MQGKGIQWNTCYTQILSKTNVTPKSYLKPIFLPILLPTLHLKSDQFAKWVTVS